MFGFTGEETDGGGLVYLRARYYNPAIGQFFNLDPFEGSTGQPFSLNRYAYVQDNPVNLIDPSGLIMESPSEHNACFASTSNSCTLIPLNNSGRTDEQVDTPVDKTLFQDWGVILTNQCNRGYTWSSDNIANLTSAFSEIDSRLRQTVGLGFKEVLGGVEFRHIYNAELTAAETPNRNLTKWGPGGFKQNLPTSSGSTIPYGLDVYPPDSRASVVDTVIHELGHLFDYRTGGTSKSNFTYSLSMRGVAEAFNLGRPIVTNVGRKAEARVLPDSLAEVTADHFLNWIAQSYRTDRGIDPDNYPGLNTDRTKSISDRDPERISAYWKGGYFLNNNNDFVSSPGVYYWATAARWDAWRGTIAFQNL